MKKIILMASLVAVSLQGMDQSTYQKIASGQQADDVSGIDERHIVPVRFEVSSTYGFIGDGKASKNHVSVVVGPVLLIKNSQSPYVAIAKQDSHFINPQRLFNSSKKNKDLKCCDLRFMQHMPNEIRCLGAGNRAIALTKIEFGLRLLHNLHTGNEQGARALIAWLTPEQAVIVLGGAEPYVTQTGLQTYKKITQTNGVLFLLGQVVNSENLKKEFDRIAAEALSIAKTLSAEATKAAANMLSRAKIQVDERIGGFYGITTGVLISIAAYLVFLRNK